MVPATNWPTSGTYTFTYDVLDRVATVNQLFGYSLTFTYDAAGNRTRVEDSAGGVTTSVYDAANRLTSRQFGGAGQTPLRIDQTYTVRDQQATAVRYSDLAGTTKVGESAFTYDTTGRLTNLQHKNGSLTVFGSYTYTYDLASRVLTETLNGTTTTFSYDTTHQLINDSATTYSYDANGNRTMTGYQTGTANQLTSDGTWTYTYDYEGNLTKKSQGSSAETWTYGYDHRNQLLWVEKRATDGGTLQLRADYTYDVFDNRIIKSVDQGGQQSQTRFVLDGWKVYQDAQGNRLAFVGNENWDVWADLNGQNGLQIRYLRGDIVDQLFARISSSGTAAWYLTDRLGSVRNLVDATGALQATLTYDGFGNVLANTNPSFGDRYKWTGRELDSETGLQYSRARYLDPELGRWISADPSGFVAGDVNLYRYVNNGSLNALDPSGLEETYKLSIDAASEPIMGKGGAFAWPISWKLDQPAHRTKGGIIVQRVHVSWDVKWAEGALAGQSFSVQIFNHWFPQRVPKTTTYEASWYEVWLVAPGATESYEKSALPAQLIAEYKKYDVTIDPTTVANDWYFLPPAGLHPRTGKVTKTSGWIKIKGKARYYNCLTEDDLKKAGFKRGATFTGSGKLYSYHLAGSAAQNNERAIQAFLARAEHYSNEVDHNLGVKWDPADDEGRTKITEKAP